MLGKRADRKPHEPWSLEQLRADMNDTGIADALVRQAWSRDVDPALGNEELTRAIAGIDSLHGCWSILPPATGELAEPDPFIKAMLGRNVSAAVAYPRAQTFSLAAWSIGKILRSLESHRIPFLLPFEQSNWEEVEALCGTYVYLPIIVTDLNYRQLRFLLPLWEKFQNLFVDLSWFSIHDGLAALADRKRLGQVLFGTRYPQFEPGAAVSMVTYANISLEEKERVAGGTLRGLLKAIRRDVR